MEDGIPISRTILADINQFVRGNPILSTAILGSTTAGITAGIVTIGRRRKAKRKKTSTTRRRKTTRRKAPRRKKATRRRKVTHRIPRHSGHKRVSFTTKDGKRVNFLVKKKAHTHRRR